MISGLNPSRWYVQPVRRTDRTRNEAPPAPKPFCPACNQVGMFHCSDPVNCGGVIYHATQAYAPRRKGVGLTDVALNAYKEQS